MASPFGKVATVMASVFQGQSTPPPQCHQPEQGPFGKLGRVAKLN